MTVEQIWIGNALRNFNYLVGCPSTGDALAIDPLDFQRCLDVAKTRGWKIRQIVNTHEHGDHIAGNRNLVKATGAQVIAHRDASNRIPDMNRGVGAGDIINVGDSIEFEVMDTPGHTMSHICLFQNGESPVLFSGDTVFNAGAGNCHNGGHPEELYTTFADQIGRLPGQTRLYPGHDYLVTNLGFSLDREPDNEAARAMLDACATHDPDNAVVTTLEQERTFNVFMRLDSPSVIARVRESHPDIGENPTPGAVFLALRELRNRW